MGKKHKHIFNCYFNKHLESYLQSKMHHDQNYVIRTEIGHKYGSYNY